jgi:hypothetical protein
MKKGRSYQETASLAIRAVFDPNRETVKLFHALPAAKQLAAPMKPLCQPAKTS